MNLSTLTNAEAVNIVAAFAGAISAIAACITIRRSSKDRADERHLDYAVRTLERAYRALCGNDGAGLAPADRLAWLTAARLLEQYKAVKAQISSKVVLAECEGHEEHWRHQFYLALEPLSRAAPSDYFQGHSPVHPVSAIIVHAFASWPDKKKDPIDVYDSAEDATNKLGVNKMWIPLRRYLNIL